MRLQISRLRSGNPFGYALLSPAGAEFGLNSFGIVRPNRSQMHALWSLTFDRVKSTLESCNFVTDMYMKRTRDSGCYSLFSFQSTILCDVLFFFEQICHFCASRLIDFPNSGFQHRVQYYCKFNSFGSFDVLYLYS